MQKSLSFTMMKQSQNRGNFSNIKGDTNTSFTNARG